MRRLLTAAALLLTASSLFAAKNRNESYISYDDGSTVINQAGDRDIDARVNMPIFAGDEIRSGRRGRTEVRLSDGNVIALDRDTVIRLRSLADSYDSDANESIISFRGGKVIVQRTDYSSAPLRVDSQFASFVGGRDSIYVIEADGSGSERVMVFEGAVEVRTEESTERVRAGEDAKLDDRGIYTEDTLTRGGTTDFERWYLRRAERYDRRSSRYLDSRFAYWDSDLDSYGSWVYVNEYGSYVWRPRVTIGWRPYYYGSWRYSPAGSLVWASDEPWGWLPYHYGRWAYTPVYGWVWLPGNVYSPAWVYWAFGPSYVGWVPAGWYDCHPPYYDWMYRRNPRIGIDFGLGFYGRVNFRDVDLRGWTFAGSGQLVSTRIDRAALTTDMVRDRLNRDGSITVASGATRFTRDQLKNPADAVINRNPSGGGTGKGDSGSLTDMTSFFRRDSELPSAVRDRLTRGSGESAAAAPSRGSSPSGGVISRDGGSTGSTSPRGGIDRGSVAGVDRGTDRGTVDRGGIDRGSRSGEGSVGRDGGVVRTTPSSPSGDSEWRNRLERPRDSEGSVGTAPRSRDDDWRSRGSVRRDPPADSGTSSEPAPRAIPRDSGSSSDDWRRPAPGTNRDVDETPRLVIDRITGDRGVRPAPRTDSGSERPAPRTVDRPTPAERPRSIDRSNGGERQRSAPAPRTESRGDAAKPRSTNIDRD